MAADAEEERTEEAAGVKVAGAKNVKSGGKNGKNAERERNAETGVSPRMTAAVRRRERIAAMLPARFLSHGRSTQGVIRTTARINEF